MKYLALLILYGCGIELALLSMDHPRPNGMPNGTKKMGLKRATAMPPLDTPPPLPNEEQSPAAKEPASRPTSALRRALALDLSDPEFTEPPIFTPRFEDIISKEIGALKKELRKLDATVSHILQGQQLIQQHQTKQNELQQKQLTFIFKEQQETRATLALILTQQRSLKELLVKHLFESKQHKDPHITVAGRAYSPQGSPYIPHRSVIRRGSLPAMPEGQLH